MSVRLYAEVLMTSRWITAWLFAAALAGCTKSSTGMSPEPAPTPAKPTPAPDPQPEVRPDPPVASVTVEIASVTLADQCGSSGRMQPPVKTAQAPAKPAASEPAVVAPAKVGPGARVARRACEQTSMQLALKATAGEKVAIKKVELLDANGKLINELAATAPQKWDGSAYAGWDEKVAAGDDIAVAYALGAPDWNKIGGRYAANGKTFQLRVTLALGAHEKVVEKQAIAAAHIEPAVPT
jgi:hypothetical protein